MLPLGTVTFLFKDIEASTTQLWETQPEAIKSVLTKHDAVLREAIESNYGYLVKTTGEFNLGERPRLIDGISNSICIE